MPRMKHNRAKPNRARAAKRRPHAVVVGAGAFGGWTALHLVELGARVTLVDAWGAGHLRGTSSDESRIIRCGYGGKDVYSRWAWRARTLWQRYERAWHTHLFVPSGVLWLIAEEDDYTRSSIAGLDRLKIPYQRLALADVERRFPQFSAEGLRFAYFEPKAGFLRARAATRAVTEAVAHEGGRVITAEATEPTATGPRLKALALRTGDAIEADHFVFACGPWLPQLFPALLGRRILPTKQEVFYFGPPAGDARFDAPGLPAWIEPNSSFYGISADSARGVKIADDRSGLPFDPTHGERDPSPQALHEARAYLERRLPGMRGAPLVESRVCQYERTPDSHLVLDRHPRYENVWLVGGGSGHGFKLGPALGEFVARQVLHRKAEAILPQMRLGACAWPDLTARPATRSF
jgi:glycine/D-amino acid oxidase-like deaminating enzyme